MAETALTERLLALLFSHGLADRDASPEQLAAALPRAERMRFASREDLELTIAGARRFVTSGR
ncbi:MAG TPA: hypothetical protein VLB44_23825 [Kofleriaceae bacterium]|nr:hypothetical protein [Kofleriaceae bacterium]